MTLEQLVLRRRMMASGGGSKDMASLAPASGVTYTSGLSGLSAEEVSAMAALISNEPTITKDTLSSVYVDYGNIHRKLDIGNQITLALNGTNYAFDIIGFNHDTLTTATAYGESTATGKAGITLQMHDCYATIYAHYANSPRNDVGWTNSEIRITTMALMKGYLPSAWQSAIKPVNKTTSVGGYYGTTVETVSDSCFIPSEIEIAGNNNNSRTGEGSQYAYYKAGNSKIKTRNGSAYRWWTRSPKYYDHSYYVYVYSDGTIKSRPSMDASGIAMCFCV